MTTLLTTNTTHCPPMETDRKKRRKTTGDEKAILSQLSEYKEKLPETAVEGVLSKLSPDWNSERVKLYWSNNLRGRVIERNV